MRIALFTAAVAFAFSLPAAGQSSIPGNTKPGATTDKAAPTQTEVKPSTKATQSVGAMTVKDDVPPESGKRWRVVPVQVGSLFTSQLVDAGNHRYTRNKTRRLRLHVYNPSYSLAARVRINCGAGLTIAGVSGDIVEAPPHSFLSREIRPSGGFNTAQCLIASNTPIVVHAALEEDTNEKLLSDPDNVYPSMVDQQIVPWPAFRLDQAE
ncbi:MAG: hypothetical protein R3C58_03225 [Parvularculaceae bacterium]